MKASFHDQIQLFETKGTESQIILLKADERGKKKRTLRQGTRGNDMLAFMGGACDCDCDGDGSNLCSICISYIHIS